jgi:hypothetical protein
MSLELGGTGVSEKPISSFADGIAGIAGQLYNDLIHCICGIIWQTSLKPLQEVEWFIGWE